MILVFVALICALGVTSPATEDQLQASDPLIQLVEAHLGIWAVPVIGSLPALCWAALGLPPARVLRRAALQGVAAVALVAVGLPMLRLLVGPSLPAFVPPEESASPGLLLGLGAGVLEEAVFRLFLLTGAFAAARRVASPVPAGVAAALVTGLAFAGAHELGPGAGELEIRFFLTRLLIPGCAMSALFFKPGPTFLVTLHCASHLGIALLFTGD